MVVEKKKKISFGSAISGTGPIRTVVDKGSVQKIGHFVLTSYIKCNRLKLFRFCTPQVTPWKFGNPNDFANFWTYFLLNDKITLNNE